MTYRLDTCIAIFGDAGYPIFDIISEFKSFIESNSQFTLNLIIGQYSLLSPDEICYKPFSNCGDGAYWPASGCLYENTKLKFSKHVMSNVIIYDFQNKIPCFAGACECWEALYGLPFVALPFGYDPNFGLNPWGPWIRGETQRLTHEWMHYMRHWMIVR